MARIIRANKTLTCGCCGEWFKTWTGYKDQDQDDDYGICHGCQGDIALYHEKEWDKSIAVLRSGLGKEENIAKFDAMPREEQKQMVAQALEDGVMVFSMARVS